MKKRLIVKLVSCAAFLLSIFLGVTVLLTPNPVDRPETEFSAYRAVKHIKAIAAAPHTVNEQAELKRVREYLREQLYDLNAAVQFKSYDTIDSEGIAHEVTNVMGEIKGVSGDSVLLAAHYDSSEGKGAGEAPGSLGASDDAYGISVILECLRAINAQGSPKNTIRVLFTDGEEVDCLGSKAAAEDGTLDITSAKAVLNIESRGLRGPAVMFETSENNKNIVKFYADRTKNPAAWSIAPAVYRFMPNFTDFTSFTDKGMQGLNFSNLDSLDENHTPLDRVENISLSCIQGYGDGLLPVISAFAFEELPETFKTGEDMTFFTLVSGLMIRYASAYNYILLALSFLAVLAYVIIALKKKLLKPARLLFTFTVIGIALTAAVLGEGIAYLISLIFGAPFSPVNMPQIPFAGGIAIICVVLMMAGLFFILRAFVKKGWKYEELISGALITYLILQAVMTFMLPGGAFLFGWGCLAGALFATAALFVPGVLRPFTGFAAVLVAAPVIVLLHIALTIGALGVIMLLSAFPLMLSLPVFADRRIL